MLLEKEISFVVDSNPINGAVNVSSDGSTFEINLQDGLFIFFLVI